MSALYNVAVEGVSYEASSEKRRHKSSETASFAQYYRTAFRMGVKIKGINSFVISIKDQREGRIICSPYSDPDVVKIAEREGTAFLPKATDIVCLISDTYEYQPSNIYNAYYTASLDMAMHVGKFYGDYIPPFGSSTRPLIEFIVGAFFIKRGELRSLLDKKLSRHYIHMLASLAVHEVFSQDIPELEYENLPVDEVCITPRAEHIMKVVSILERLMFKMPLRHDNIDYTIEDLNKMALKYIENGIGILRQRNHLNSG